MPIKQTFKRLPALAFLFIYLLWVFASIGISALGVNLFLSLWVQLLNCVAIGILTINVLTTRRHLMVLIDTILIFSLLIALYGIYGYITKQNGTPDPINPALFRTASIFTPIAPSLAMFLSLVIPLALYRAFTLRGFKRASVLIVFLILIVTLGLTFTRASYISVPLSIVIMLFFLPSRKMKISLLTAIVALAVITVLLGTVGNFPIFQRFFSQDITTLNGRTYLWEAILSQFDPTQLLGNGFEASNLLLANLHVGPNGQGVIGTSPHSLFLGTLYDNGIIGVILLALIFIALIANIIRGMRKATGEQDHKAIFAMALAVTVSALIESIDSNDLWGQAISIYFWIIIALPFALCWLPVKQPSETDQDSFDDEVTIPRMEAIRQKAQGQIALLEGGRNGE
jgi:exopolysaccharide production protein ExoQ